MRKPGQSLYLDIRLYPELDRLKERGWVTAEWGTSPEGRRAKFYSLTRMGRKQLETEQSTCCAYCCGLEITTTGVRRVMRSVLGVLCGKKKSTANRSH